MIDENEGDKCGLRQIYPIIITSIDSIYCLGYMIRVFSSGRDMIRVACGALSHVPL